MQALYRKKGSAANIRWAGCQKYWQGVKNIMRNGFMKAHQQSRQGKKAIIAAGTGI